MMVSMSSIECSYADLDSLLLRIRKNVITSPGKLVRGIRAYVGVSLKLECSIQNKKLGFQHPVMCAIEGTLSFDLSVCYLFP